MSRFFAALQEQEEEVQEAVAAPEEPIVEEPEPAPQEEAKEEEPKEEAAGGKKKKKKRKRKGKAAAETKEEPPKKLSKAALLARERLQKKKEAEEQARKEAEEQARKEAEEEARRAEEARLAEEAAREEQARQAEERKKKREARKLKEEAEKKALREKFLRDKEEQERARKQRLAEQKARRAEEEEERKRQEAAKAQEEESSAEEEEEDESSAEEEAEEKPEAVDGEGSGSSIGDWDDDSNDDTDLAAELAAKKAAEEERKRAEKAAKAKAKEAKQRRRDEKAAQKAAKRARKAAEEEARAAEEEEAALAQAQEEIEYSDPKAVFYPDSPYRCPILCILGHVDTGKTKLLDKIRNTKVQDGEEGGITQQIGASFFPQYKLREEASKLDEAYKKIAVDVPGLLIIDTPGHESFANLRKRGESLCDFAILVVDIKHGLENQTIESLNLLKERGTPFVVALNKIDTTPSWEHAKDGSSLANLRRQSAYAQNIFDERMRPILTQLGQNDINGCLYWDDRGDHFVKMVPTSAMTGEGIPDLLGYIVDYCQSRIPRNITPRDDEFTCTVMEVKKIDGIGTTIDVILVNGILREGDRFILSGFSGVITSSVRALMTPQPLKELRVKAEYIRHKQLRGAMGFKISAVGLEQAVAGSQLYRYESEEQKEELTEMLSADIKKIRKQFKLKTEGVGVAASTLGSLEALLVFLRSKKIPVSFVCIGDVKKKDIMTAMNPLLKEENRIKKKEFATILAFDVKLNPEAEKFAAMNGVNVIIKKIIYHLFDDFMKYMDHCKEERKKAFRKKAVFPCILKPVDFFYKKDPILMGAEVLRGVLKVGTPLIIPSKNMLKLGTVISIQANHVDLQEARRSSGQVAIKIKTASNLTAGRQFDLGDNLFSHLTRRSVDILKDFFRDELRAPDIDLLRDLKQVFDF